MNKLWFEREDIIYLVRAEGKRIYEKYGLQELSDLPSARTFSKTLEDGEKQLDHARRRKIIYPCWINILTEEMLEAGVEQDPEKKKKELIQVMAVALQWYDAVERREHSKKFEPKKDDFLKKLMKLISDEIGP